MDSNAPAQPSANNTDASNVLEQLYSQNAKLAQEAAPYLPHTKTGMGVDGGTGRYGAGGDQLWSKDLVEFLGVSTLLFGIIAMVLMFILFLRNRTTDLVLRAFGIPLIIVSAVFLIVAGYTEKQIAPVMGLLGTIAGYLLAKTDTHPNGAVTPPAAPAQPPAQPPT